ncbi:MAG: phosphogluconate dehydratase, partial [Rhodobacteraceae bacterium]|nr:phosphogluconate dehydratase [Paracoccaceae bacterium]
MKLNTKLSQITEEITNRSSDLRSDYLAKIDIMVDKEPNRAHLSCGNQAHAYAAMGSEKPLLAEGRSPNLGIITAYNDMLSAHQPFAEF